MIPLPMQYVYWLSGALRGDFGTSAVTKRAVIQDIKEFAPATIELVLWAGFPSILVALYLGVTSAQHKNKWQDYLCRFLGYIFVATPTFVFAVIVRAGVRLLDPCAAYDRRTASARPLLSRISRACMCWTRCWADSRRPHGTPFCICCSRRFRWLWGRRCRRPGLPDPACCRMRIRIISRW